MIDIEKIHYVDGKKIVKESSHTERWILILFKRMNQNKKPEIAIGMVPQSGLSDYLKITNFDQMIIASLKLKSFEVDYVNVLLDLKKNSEIVVLVHLLFTRFENQDSSYAIEVALDMIIRKTIQMNLELLKKQFEVFKLIQFIQDNIYHKVTVEELAVHMSMSRSTLRRFCIQQLGKPANDLIRNIRIDEAKNLLEMTDISTVKIAEKLGYFSSSTFNRAFKHYIGVLPEIYRSNYKLESINITDHR